MKRGQNFNIKRYLLLIRNDLFLNRFLLFITAVAAMGVLLLLFIYNAFSPLPGDTYIYVGFYGIFLGGLLITWRLFGNLHDEIKGGTWHMLPASLLEKFSSRLVLSTIIYTCAWYLFLFVLSAISEALSRWLFDSRHLIFNPFKGVVLSVTIKIWIFQSILMFGVVYFRKYAFAKTVLALVIYIFLVGLVGVLAQDLLFGKYASDIEFKVSLSMRVLSLGGYMSEELAAFFSSGAAKPILSAAEKAQHVLFAYLLMPVCWVMGYFRLKEMEV